MERPTDELVRRLLAAADAAADDRAARVVAEAAQQAEAEVRDLVKSALTAALLRRAVAHLEGRPPSTPAEEPRAVAEPAAVVADAVSAEAAPAATQAHVTDADRPCYVYCVVRARLPLELSGLPGVDPSSPPRMIRHRDLHAVVSDVSPGTFDDAALAERARDLEWIGQKVRAHDRVIKRATEAGPVIPLRFGMVLKSAALAAELLARHHDALAGALDRLNGKREWGVKIFARETPSPDRVEPGEDVPRSGRTYLLERTRSSHARTESRRAVQACVQDCHTRLSAIADESTMLPLARRNAAGSDADAGELVLNAAYLVTDASVDRFESLVTDLAAQYAPDGFAVERTGPWPAYNFVDLELSAGEAPRA